MIKTENIQGLIEEYKYGEKKGSEEIFNVLCDFYTKIALNKVRGRLKNETDINDYIQDVMMLLIEKIDSYNTSYEDKFIKFTTYFYTILEYASNEIINKINYPSYNRNILRGKVKNKESIINYSNILNPIKGDEVLNTITDKNSKINYTDILNNVELNNDERIVSEMLLKGYTPKEISLEINKAQSRVYQIWNTICAKVYDEYN